MPSPFPGMDPFIESQEWSDFHATLMTVLREQLTPQISPKYTARVERRVYLERPEETTTQFIPDMAIVGVGESGTLDFAPIAGASDATETTGAPATCLLPELEEHRQYFLVIRERETHQIVTVIELLSPTNKRENSEGREQYLSKRNDLLRTQTNLVEIDLLRGGLRLPMASPLPSGDYFAIVRRKWRGRLADVHAWTVRDPLPTIPIPLVRDEPEPELDLQTAFNLTFDRAAYNDTLDYGATLKPPWESDDDDAWMRGIVGESK